MINSGAEYLKSPLLDADPEQYDLRQLGDELEKELKSMASGDYSPSFTDENLVNYSFEDSIQNQNPSWWRPRVIARLEQKDPTVEKWMETVEQGLDGNENYTLVRKDCLDPLTGEKPQVYVKIGDYEQINENIRVETLDQETTLGSIPEAMDLIEQQVPQRDYTEKRPSYTTERNGFNVRVDPDLSAGFFQANVEVGPDVHSSEIWMPYADRENALLVGTPSQFSPETESTVVQVQGDSFTGDPLKDAIAESLDYFLLFEGLQQPEVTPEAIDHRNENPLGTDPYRIQIRSDAWNSFQDLDNEYQKRVQDKLDQIAMSPGRSPVEVRETGKLDQVGSEDIFIEYREHEQSQTLELKDIMTRNEAYVNKGNNNTRT
jgi:mRNA-degrading endonuclease RelE of RelBE toxin-antitoxin system